MITGLEVSGGFDGATFYGDLTWDISTEVDHYEVYTSQTAEFEEAILVDSTNTDGLYEFDLRFGTLYFYVIAVYPDGTRSDAATTSINLNAISVPR